MRCLVVRAGEDTIRFPNPTVEARLGSEPSNEYVVRFPGVSRFHARVLPGKAGPELHDLGSKNGLVLDGRCVERVVLLPGTVVYAGTAAITSEEGATSDFETALTFRSAVAGRLHRDPAETDTVRYDAAPGAAEALRFVRATAREQRADSRPPEVARTLERLRAALKAGSVALLESSRDGWTVPVNVGSPLDLADSSLGNLDEGETFRVIPCEGRTVALARTGGCPGCMVVVVMEREVRSLAPWQRELISFAADELRRPGPSWRGAGRPDGGRGTRLVLPDGMVAGNSPAMRDLLSRSAKVAGSRVDVLVHGETGTGKELVARLLHLSGPMACGPFVAINCAAIPAELLEAELFGVRARVATGVDPQPGRILEAEGGTLLLDEIGELPLSLQPKLLRFLQEREVRAVGASRPRAVDVRVVSTTNRDPLEEVRAGRFRADLYYRLRGVEIRVPPLRERAEDIGELVALFAERAAALDGKVVPGLRRKALRLLMAYDWPGNVRELQSEVRRAVLFCPDGSHLEPEQFHLDRSREAAPPSHATPGAARPAFRDAIAGSTPSGAPGPDLKSQIAEVERKAIAKALESTSGNKSAAARILGLTRAGLAMKVRRLMP